MEPYSNQKSIKSEFYDCKQDVPDLIWANDIKQEIVDGVVSKVAGDIKEACMSGVGVMDKVPSTLSLYLVPEVKTEPQMESSQIKTVSFDSQSIDNDDILETGNIFVKAESAVKNETDILNFFLPDNQNVVGSSEYAQECKSIIPGKIEPSINIEENEAINESGQIDDGMFEAFKIKNEELVLKEEDSRLNKTGVVSRLKKHNEKIRKFQQHRHDISQKHQSSEVNIFKCDQCSFQTVHKCNLKTHLLRHKRPEEVHMLKCDQCDYQTIEMGHLKRHLLRHKNPEEINTFKCNQCSYQAIQKSYLKMHLLRHLKPDEVNTFKCNECEYWTVKKIYLKWHVLRHKNPNEINMFKCDQCNYQSIKKGNLKNHLLVHRNSEEVSKFKCDQCDFQTSYKKCLQNHLLLHKNPEEVNMFKCDQCDYQAIKKCNLNRHLLLHRNPEEVNTFKCNQCEYQAIQKNYLKIHLLRHNNPKQLNVLTCDRCSYQTYKTRNLKRHLLKHKKPDVDGF